MDKANWLTQFNLSSSRVHFTWLFPPPTFSNMTKPSINPLAAWLQLLDDWFGFRHIPDFLITMINSLLGYRGITDDDDSDQPGLQSVIGTMKGFSKATAVVKPTRRHVRRQSCNLDKAKKQDEQFPAPHFRFRHPNCYPCIKGVCGVRQRKRDHPPKTHSRYGKYRERKHALIYDNEKYDADDEAQPPFNYLPLISSDDESEEEDKQPPGQPKKVEKRGNCTFYYGYGG